MRWADHVGISLYERIIEAHAFLAASLNGGKAEPTDLELTAEEKAFAENAMSGASESGYDDESASSGINLLRDPERAPSVHATLWKPLKDLAAGDPDMNRSYGVLPDTK